MDTALKNGDFCLGTTGKPFLISGAKEILQRALIRLTVKKGSFIYDKNLGSRLYTLKSSTGNLKNTASILVNEALADMKEVKVDSVDVSFADSAENLRISVNLSIDKNKEELEVIV